MAISVYADLRVGLAKLQEFSREPTRKRQGTQDYTDLEFSQSEYDMHDSTT